MWLGGSDVKSTPHSSLLRKVQSCTGGYAILFRDTVFDLLIKRLGEEKDIADICYSKTPMNKFRTSFNFVFHKDGYSTIQKKNVSYPQLNK